MELRDYQLKALTKIIDDFKKGSDQLYIKAATGSGKTFIAANLIKTFLDHPRRPKILFIVPRNILIQQTVNAFSFLQEEIGVYNAELGLKQIEKRVVIASVQSIVNYKDDLDFNVVIYDECHRARNTHKVLWDKIKKGQGKSYLIGLTATDYDIDKNLFPLKSFDIGLKALTDQGYLAKLHVGAGRSKIDTSLLKIQNGDYSTRSIEEQLSTEKMTEQCTDMIARTQDRKRVIILCASIKHAESVALIVKDSIVFHSKLKKDIRNENLSTWKKEGKYLVSVLAASEGFDAPPTDCIVFMRPTRSATLYEQAIGRAARKSEGKEDGLILDYGGVVSSLGLPYNIKPIPKNEVSSKECPECLTENELKNSHCSYCKNPFLVKCNICSNEKLFGEKCCDQEPRDDLKNLNMKAYSKNDSWKKVGSILHKKHVSKNGNVCLKLTFMEEGVFGYPICDMFFLADKPMFGEMERHYQTVYRTIFEKERPDSPLDLLDFIPVNIPSKVFVVPNGKYKKVQSMDFTN